MQYTSIYLVGFRGTGKSTLGKILAHKLGWQFFEMDQMIVEKAGMPISELTENGKNWQRFRQIEHDVLTDLSTKTKIVVSTGGGVFVNTIVKDGTNQTFGEINTEVLRSLNDAFVLLLTCSDDEIAQRIRTQETRKETITRPLLDETKAKALEDILATVDEDQKHEVIINAIVSDSLDMYQTRKPLYAALTKHMIDTSKMSVEGACEQALKLFYTSSN